MVIVLVLLVSGGRDFYNSGINGGVPGVFLMFILRWIVIKRISNKTLAQPLEPFTVTKSLGTALG